MRRELKFIDATRARPVERVPVVLTRSEVDAVLAEPGGRDLLVARLLYGAGLRHPECLRLRVMDVAFEESQLVIRDTKGQRDRVTVLPRVVADDLRSQIETARRVHQENRRYRAAESLDDFRYDTYFQDGPKAARISPSRRGLVSTQFCPLSPARRLCSF